MAALAFGLAGLFGNGSTAPDDVVNVLNTEVCKAMLSSQSQCVQTIAATQIQGVECKPTQATKDLVAKNCAACFLSNPGNEAAQCSIFCSACVQSGNSQDQTISVTSNCQLTSNVADDTKTDFKDNIKQGAGSSTFFGTIDDFLSGKKTSATNTNESFLDAITESVIQSAMDSAASSQTQYISGDGGMQLGNKQTVTINLMATAIMNDTVYHKAVTAFANDISNNVPDSSSSLFVVIMLVLFVLFLLYLLYRYYKKKQAETSTVIQLQGGGGGPPSGQ